MTTQMVNNIHENYLIINYSSQQLIDYQYNILRKYRVPHLLKVANLSDGQENLLYYDVNSMNTLYECLNEQTFMSGLMIQLVKDFLKALREIHVYLLYESCIDLTIEHIFYEINEHHFYFLYKPVTSDENKEIKEQFFNLINYLVKHVNQHDFKAVSLAHRLRILVESDTFHSRDIQLIIEDIESISEEQLEEGKVSVKTKEAKKRFKVSQIFGKK